MRVLDQCQKTDLEGPSEEFCSDAQTEAGLITQDQFLIPRLHQKGASIDHPTGVEF